MSINTHTYKATLDIPWGKLQYIIEWCTDNCKSDWNFAVVESGNPGKYFFTFKEEKDYCIFLLVIK